MWKNKRIISTVIVVIISIGFANTIAADAAPAPIEYEGRFELFEPLPVGLAAGTAEYPELVRIEWIRFDARYGNSWGVTAHIGWLPVEDATWLLRVELLDDKGNVLHNSRDEPTVFTGKASDPGQTNMRFADLDLDPMTYQGRRHATRFRIRLESSQELNAPGDSPHTLEVTLVDRETQKPITDAAIIASTITARASRRRDKSLYYTDSQGRCNVTLAKGKLSMIDILAQKQGYCTMQKSWSSHGSWGIERAPLTHLPKRHVLEMVPASALGGIVQDAEGKAIKGAEVDLNSYLEEPSGRITVMRTVRTDGKGRWRIDGVTGEEESITLQVSHPDYGGNNRKNIHILVEALLNARSLKHVEILEKGVALTGRVLDERERPIAGAIVMLNLRFYAPIYVTTDASGTFRLMCSNDPSVYRETTTSIIVETPGYAPIQQVIDIPLKPESLEFHLERGRSISCRVVDTNGQPIPGVWTIVDPLPEKRDYSIYLKDTNDQGETHIQNAPQNDVTFHLLKQGYFSLRDRIVTSSENEVVFTMKRELRVHGRVTDAETGQPIPNFDIAVEYESGGRTRTSDPVGFAEGTYEVSFDETQPETRQLKVSAVGYVSATSDQMKSDEGNREINFKLTRSASFDEKTAGRPREQVQPTGLRWINGMVRDQDGKPVPDAIVTTCPWMGKETITNAKGAFKLKVDERLRSMREEEVTYLLARQKERNLAAAVEFDISASEIDVALKPGAILSGKVVDAEGKGVTSAKLSLTFWTSNMGYGVREEAKVDKEGNYEIRAVPGGHKYSVNARAEGYGETYVQVNTSETANERLEIETLVLSLANLSASGIVVDDFDQPVSGIRIYAYGNGQPERETFTDTEGRFTIENVCPGQLNIQANSRDRTTRRLHGRTRTEGGAKDIKIVVYEMDQRGRRVQTQPPSLIGKPLPDLKDIGLNLSSTDIEDKKILVCFWDMNQRPSRHCMTQLAKQIETLKAKGIVLISVQASKMDSKVLDEWAKKNNISYSAMIEGDIKKIKFTWGIQSLPWLILTDPKQVVFAEGFPFSELEKKLKQLGEK
ncbi:MAG: carboxypeptidase regulatory-like domain-containing protein [Sedimentisphaerales bacterium]|nr:carboxypeptidase regulatory-like domain-containing protein [Sedimentisphaerales bacterium]